MASQEECRYCGNEHDVKELCRARRVGRRAFLFALGAAAAAAAMPAAAPTELFKWVEMDGVAFRGYAEDAFIGTYRAAFLVLPRPLAVAYNALVKEDRRYALAPEPEPVRRLRDVQRRG